MVTHLSDLVLFFPCTLLIILCLACLDGPSQILDSTLPTSLTELLLSVSDSVMLSYSILASPGTAGTSWFNLGLGWVMYGMEWDYENHRVEKVK